MGDSLTLIDSGAETVSEVSTILDYYNISEKKKSDNKRANKFYTTGSTKLFYDIASVWLEMEDVQVERAILKGASL